MNPRPPSHPDASPSDPYTHILAARPWPFDTRAFLIMRRTRIFIDDLKDFTVQRAVGRDGVAAANRPPARPICKRAAGLFDDWQKRRAVPDVHHGVKHALGAAVRHEHVPVAIAPSAPRAEALLQLTGRRAEAVTRA